MLLSKLLSLTVFRNQSSVETLVTFLSMSLKFRSVIETSSYSYLSYLFFRNLQALQREPKKTEQSRELSNQPAFTKQSVTEESTSESFTTEVGDPLAS